MEAVRFDPTGWTKQADETNPQVWLNADGDGLGLYFYNLPPDLPHPLTDLDSLRHFYRAQIVEAGGGLVLVDTIMLDGLLAIKTIFKMPQPMSGVTYIGSYTLPRRDFSYVLKLQCAERGLTGMREAIIFNEEAPKLTYDPNGIIQGWSADPYDPTIKDGTPLNLAEAQAYDARFPQHPLSRLRRVLSALEPTIRLSADFKNASPFDRSEDKEEVTKKKTGWKFW